MRAKIDAPVRSRRPLLLMLLACFALLVAPGAATASPALESPLAVLAQQTGGSFGGSRWGSGSTPSGGGSYSTGGGSYSSGGSSSSSGSGSSDGIWVFFQLVIWCFAVSPVLGFSVLGIGLVFLLAVWGRGRS
jgi:uncharacterized membrane protein